MSSALARTETVDGWTLAFASKDGEPLVRDLDLATRAGMTDPHAIRRVIEKAAKDGDIAIPIGDRNRESAGFAMVVTETVKAGATSKTIETYYLDEDAALEILLRLRTPAARALKREVRRVYLAYRRGLLAPAHSNSACIGDSPSMRDDVRLGVDRVRRARGYSVQKVHGFLRRAYRVGSPFAVLQGRVGDVLRDLQQLETCVVSLYSARAERLLEAEKRKSDKQLKLGGKGWEN